jgi:uncharacterized protein (TIGR02246 family)
MATATKTTEEVLALLHRWVDAYSQRDLQGVLATFADEPDLVAIGTGADERRVGLAALREQIARDFEQSERLDVTVGWTSVAERDGFALLAAEADIVARVDKETIEIPIRITAVAERRDGGWRFTQTHISTPDREQPEGESFAVE